MKDEVLQETAERQPAVGTLVDDRYQLTELLGGGGAGQVFRAQDQSTGSELALKVLNPHLGHGFSLTRFVREYRIGSRLKDPRMVQAHDFGTTGASYYLTMDLMRGGSLRPFREQVLPRPAAVGLILQALSALDFLHARHITHRDIKPQNILLEQPWSVDKPGSAGAERHLLPRLRLSDFGIAKVGDLWEDTRIGQVLGTVRYMAPECLTDEATDPRADLYAIGVMLYEFLTGHHPLEGNLPFSRAVHEYLNERLEIVPIQTRAPDVPELLAAATMALLQRDVQQRPRTAALAALTLEEWWRTEAHPYLLPDLPAAQGSPYLAATRIVGREDELDRITRFCQEALTFKSMSPQGRSSSSPLPADEVRASVLTLSGPAGVGKSRLLAQVKRSLQLGQLLFVVGQCRPDSHTPYEGIGPLISALEQWENTQSVKNMSGDLVLRKVPPDAATSTPATSPAAQSLPVHQVTALEETLTVPPADARWKRAHRPERSLARTLTTVGCPKEPCGSSGNSGFDKAGGEAEAASADEESIKDSSAPAGEASWFSWTLPSGDETGRTPSREASSGPSSSALPRPVPSILDPEYELLRRPPRDGLDAIKQDELRRQLILEQTAARLLLAAQAVPVAVVVEDLQWVDPSSMHLLAFLMRAVALVKREGTPLRILFVLTHRPPSPEHPLTGLTEALEQQEEFERPPLRVVLEPLTQHHTVELTAAMLMEPVNQAVERFCQAVFEHRDVTPLYVEQGLRFLLNQEVLTQGMQGKEGRWNGRWNLSPSPHREAHLPATIQEAIGERAARLSVSTQTILALAATLGRVFELDLLTHMNRLDPHATLDCLDEATEAGFVSPLDVEHLADMASVEARRFAFTHDRYRESLYESLPAEQRRSFHYRAAAAVAELRGETAETSELLAHHSVGAEAWANAYRWAEVAADKARGRGAPERACELYALALDAAQKAGLTVDSSLNDRYGDACAARGDFDRAAEQYGLRIASLPAGRERWDTQRRAAELNYRRHDFRHAVEPLEALLSDMGYPVPHSRLGLWWLSVGNILSVSWLFVVVGLNLLLSPSRLFARPPTGDLERLELLARTWYTLAECYLFVDFRRAFLMGSLSARLAARAGSLPYASVLWASLAFWLGRVGIRRVSRRVDGLAQKLLAASDDPEVAATACVMLLYAALFRGDVDDRVFRSLIGQGLRAARGSGDIQRGFTMRMVATLALYFSGRYGAVQRLLWAVAQLGERYQLPEALAWSSELGAILATERGQYAEGIRLSRAALKAHQRSGSPLMELTTRINLAHAAAWQRQHQTRAELEALMEEGLGYAETWHAHRFVGGDQIGRCLLTVALCAHQLGDLPTSLGRRVRRLQRRAWFFCHANRLETVTFKVAGAALSLVQGRPRRAERQLRQACALAQRHHLYGLLPTLYRVGAELFPQSSGLQRWAAHHLEQILAAIDALPQRSLRQIEAGHLGAVPSETE